MAAPHEIEELLQPHGRHGHAPELFQAGALVLVPDLQGVQGHLAPPVQHLAPLFQHLPHLRAAQKVQEALARTETARHPDQVHEAVIEGHAEFQADAHGDAHDARGMDDLGGGLQIHAVVIDHRDGAQALDPGVHDEVGGRFASLGVHVIDMVIEGQLVPGLGHLGQMVARQHAAHHTRRAQGGAAEVVGLHERTGGIAAQGRMGAGQHLVVQGLQGQQTVTRTADLQIAQQVDDGIGHAGGRRGDQLLDAVGMQLGVEEIVPRGHVGRLKDAVDQDEYVPVLPVKKNTVSESCHSVFLFSLPAARCGKSRITELCQ